jgi:tryptophan synthase alpha chain
VRAEFPDTPIGLLVYANLVVHAGAERFYARAASAGVDSVLVADAPSIESAVLERVAAAHGVAPVLIAPPNVSHARLREIASRSRGYVYVTSRPGVTGVDSAVDLHADAAGLIERLRAIEPSPAPALLGFGIGTPAHVRRALAMGAAGAICGSAIAARIGRLLDGDGGSASALEGLLEEITVFVLSMKQATLR